ncbi:hypothetical protein KAR91_33665 [Candidatus Pacearchaeota archaeon]|nr:hypothetical protein [Candidatus Pacearchaeota archaeon]
MTRQIKYFPLQGGEDLITPALTIKPGKMIFTRNYECDQQGRPRRVDGFERFDGSPAPSDASYWILDFDASDTEVLVGDTVTGDSSGSTGTAILDGVLESGTYGGSDAAGYIVLTDVDADYTDDEDLTVSAAKVAEAVGVGTTRGADTDALDATYLQTAIEYRRDNGIGVVPGSGNILGGCVYNGVEYVFRNNAGGTAAVLFKSSAAGWVLVPLGDRLEFTSGGTYEISEGDAIVGDISGATATVSRVVVTDGTWAGGDVVGYLVFTSHVTEFQAETIHVGANPDVATVAGPSTAITLLPDGRYECYVYNFFGQAGSLRMYGVDGVNLGFEFDGTVFCPITTGQPTDTPTHVRAFKKHLFYMYPGGSVKHSGTGYPLKWGAISGALEIGIGDDTIGMELVVGGVLCLWGRNSTHLLYGNDATDWDLKNHSRESGAIEWTIQPMVRPVYLDDRGVTGLDAVQAFGDFKSNAMSQPVGPVIEAKRGLANASIRVRNKDQYRIFFTDNTGLNFTFNGSKLLGITRLDYGKPVKCTFTGEIDGVEKLYFGSDDGYLYHLDSGTSFDGEEVEAVARLPFAHLGSPENRKRFFKAVLELDAPARASLAWVDDYNYGKSSGRLQDLVSSGGGGFWNIDDWNDFLWSSTVVGEAVAYLQGSGRNIGIMIKSNATYEKPHTLQGLIMHYEVRGLSR